MHDHVGFEFSCDHAQIGWVAVRFVREWVHTMPHASPFPRRQELPRGSYHVGAPPRGVRCYVLSHAWASSNHPSPSGSKYRLVTQALDADGAADEDVIFLECVCMHMHACMHANPDPDPVNPDPDPDPDPDPNSYASLFQPGRLKRSEPPLAWAPQREWTEAERQLFIHATSEISSLYSFTKAAASSSSLNSNGSLLYPCTLLRPLCSQTAGSRWGGGRVQGYRRLEAYTWPAARTS